MSLVLVRPRPSCFPIRIRRRPGGKLEPIEECTVLVKEEYAGGVVQKLTMRKGEMVSYETEEDGWVKVVMEVPARGLIGYMAGEFKNDVHGQG
jgi:GTP-binding protein